MKSEQGDDNDATCGRGGDVRIHPPTPTPPRPPVPSVHSESPLAGIMLRVNLTREAGQ